MFMYTRFRLPRADATRTRTTVRPPRRRPLRATPAPTLYPPAYGTESFRVWSLWLGHRLAEEPVDALEVELAHLAAVAVAAGVEVDSAQLLTDRARDDVRRSRAFYKVAMALDHLEPHAMSGSPGDDPLAA